MRDLRYFVAVATHGDFTRAAEALYVSQPALSKQVRALERQLRMTLFDRAIPDMRPSDWQRHYGDRWSTVARLKRRYDPAGVLAPRQRIFG